MGKLILRGLFWKNMGRKVIAQELEEAKARMRETCVRLKSTLLQNLQRSVWHLGTNEDGQK